MSRRAIRFKLLPDSPKGLTPKGMTPKGLTPKGMTVDVRDRHPR